MKSATLAIAAFLLGAAPVQEKEPELIPGKAVLKKTRKGYQVRIKMEAKNLPDNTMVRLQMVPVIQLFDEGSKKIEETQLEKDLRRATKYPIRRAPLRGNSVEMKYTIPSLGTYEARYFFDNKDGTYSKQKKKMYPLGNILARTRGFSSEVKKLQGMEEDLRKLLVRFGRMEQNKSAGREGKKLGQMLATFGDKAADGVQNSSYSAAMNLMWKITKDMVNFTATMIYEAGSGGDDSSKKFDDTEEEPEDDAKIEGKLAEMLAKRFKYVAGVIRREALVGLVQETDHLIAEAIETNKCDKKELEAVEKLLDSLVKFHAGELPTEIQETLRKAFSKLSMVGLVGAEEVTAFQEELNQVQEQLRKQKSSVASLK